MTILDLQSFIDWQQEEKTLYASDTELNKQLYCTLRGSYEVYHNGDRVLETMQPFDAVEKFNSITEKS